MWRPDPVRMTAARFLRDGMLGDGFGDARCAVSTATGVVARRGQRYPVESRLHRVYCESGSPWQGVSRSTSYICLHMDQRGRILANPAQSWNSNFARYMPGRSEQMPAVPALMITVPVPGSGIAIRVLSVDDPDRLTCISLITKRAKPTNIA